jgi:hypothetical protein
MNLALSLAERLLKKARRVVAAMGKSVDQLIRDYLEQLTARSEIEDELAEIRRLSREGGGDSRGWKFDRDELHARPGWRS